MAKPKSLTGEECDMHHFRVLSGILLPWEMVDTSQHFAASVLCEANKSIAHLPSKCDQGKCLTSFTNVGSGWHSATHTWDANRYLLHVESTLHRLSAFPCV
jgi:hypothetical protein